MARLVIAAVLIALGCHVRVMLAPGLYVPLPAVLLALIGAAAAVLVAAIVRNLKRDGWRLCPYPRPACSLGAPALKRPWDALAVAESAPRQRK
jgi:hypothetical protein